MLQNLIQPSFRKLFASSDSVMDAVLDAVKASAKDSVKIRLNPLITVFAMSTALFAISSPSYAASEAHSAAALRAKYQSVREGLKNNQFNRPIIMESNESPNRLQGEIYALVDYPLAEVNASLSKPGNWCDVLILHLNTKQCRISQGKGAPILSVSVGKKSDQPVEDAYRVDFNFNSAQTTPDYLDVRLQADKGPLGTSDYRIALDAAAVDGGKTFLHLSYSYGYGFASKVAMQGYLATVASDKVGFTKSDASGNSAYIGGIRGLVERNTMRYYLAIDSFLDARDAAPAEQLEQRLQSWFAATERYPRQLHEIDRATYLTMKRNEYRRQQSLQ